jgi:hypothetical protein
MISEDRSTPGWKVRCCQREMCAKEFQPVNGNQIYCNKLCRFARNREKNLSKYNRRMRKWMKATYKGEVAERKRAAARRWYWRNREHVLEHKKLKAVYFNVQ